VRGQSGNWLFYLDPPLCLEGDKLVAVPGIRRGRKILDNTKIIDDYLT
jgi:hypothetical protein